MTGRIGEVLTTAIKDSDPGDCSLISKQNSAGIEWRCPALLTNSVLQVKSRNGPSSCPKPIPTIPNQIGNMGVERASGRALAVGGDADKGEALFKSQSCIACHTTADGQTPKGPHLVEIGKRYKPAELVESILKPSAKLAQGYETYQFAMVDGRILQGFVVSERANSTVIREANGTQHEIMKSNVKERLMQKLSAMPEGLTANLTPEQLADLLAYLQSLK